MQLPRWQGRCSTDITALNRGGGVSSINGHKPYDLTPRTVSEVVTRVSAGNYLLGRVGDHGFLVQYVGRSDRDLAKELRSWARDRSHHKAFTFGYASDPKAAFERECEDFHDYGGTETLDNAEHPKRPANADWLCPRCDFYA